MAKQVVARMERKRNAGKDLERLAPDFASLIRATVAIMEVEDNAMAHATQIKSTQRSARIGLRMSPAAKRALQRAATVRNKTLTEFLLDSGMSAAFDSPTAAFLNLMPSAGMNS
jgi:hypothetical protein